MIGLIVVACQFDEGEKQVVETKSGESDGRQLSEIHCGGCHQYAEPSLLDSTSWSDFMLPRMGHLLGFYREGEERANLLGRDSLSRIIVDKAGLFPKEPTITAEEWNLIQEYYLDNAPQKLPKPEPQNLKVGIPGFEVVYPNIRMDIPSTTMLKIRPEGGLFMGDANTQSLFVLNEELRPEGQLQLKEGAVWMETLKDRLYITVMGSFAPTDAAFGLIASLPVTGSGEGDIPINDLKRPVHMQMGDLNQDGSEDFVICEFGKWTGCLAWHEALPNGDFQKHILSNSPGAIKAYIKDFNDDGLNDVIALFGQGNERIDLYTNRGDGTFATETVIQFSPSNGSSWFALHDMDGDGKDDILYTAGDNADFTPVLKPYHGLYVFLQGEDMAFEQDFFYQLNGAYGAVPADYDQDGDLDIAAISFFPDFKNGAKESFVYLQNDGGEYQAYGLEDPEQGRWIVLDAGDYDLDGDLDLVLGSLTFEVVPAMGLVDRWISERIPFIVLENQLE
jgi:hypothetical protein